ncbi:hypothetical protein CYMTET_48924 [Cymbomonas tetramitiformis]|uniref:Uncharacterized protein n=1 Tax=Cymbomonas tetramitiformis TaxID=36881 RepID=A0AAE0EV23_9CHLO|nr:hypothetical protein CYMTET_48924 [Cymbomonas tetramitiformis]
MGGICPQEALADTRDQLEKCIKQTQETTLQWIISNFKLRRRIHFKTMGKALVWLTGPMVRSSQGAGDAMCTE